MAVVESLEPNRSLLNAKFDGYKLSSEQLSVNSATLAADVNTVSLKDDVFSHLHVKAFGWTNHLVVDHWSDLDAPESLYFVDDNSNVNQVTVKDKEVQKISNVFCIPPVEEKVPHQLNAFVAFPSKHFAFASDGVGRIYVLDTGNRSELTQWQVVFIHQINNPFTIVHSNWHEGSKILSCLLLSVTNEGGDDSVHVKHTVVLTFLMFHADIGDKGETKVVFDSQKEFHSRAVPTYAAIEPSNQGLLLASEKPFTLTSEEKVDLKESFDDANGPESKTKKEYVWTQESGSVTILYPLPEGSTKDDVVFDVKTHSIKVALTNGKVLLDGNLFAAVETDACTWTLDKRRLEITLSKVVADHVWLDVVKGDDRGRYKAGEQNLEALEDMLNNTTNGNAALFNQGELEECDMTPEDVLYIVRIDIQDGSLTHKTSLSTHQWLFTKLLKAGVPPAFCVRHDVDALLWQPQSEHKVGVNNWQHVGTLDAFGFIHASKKEQKFTSCSPDVSYAVVCDVRNHVFTYYKPPSTDKVHAEQKVVQLDDMGSEGIVGMQACNNTIYVLGKNKLFLVSAF